MKAIFRKLDHESEEQHIFLVEDAQKFLPPLEEYSVQIDVKACGLSTLNSKLLAELFRKRPCSQYPAGWEVSGIVTNIGKNVSRVAVGDRVAGLLPLDSSTSACGEQCMLQEYDMVKLPASVSFETAAACIGDGLKAYMALFYLAHVTAGDTVLFTDSAAHWATLAIQLARHCKAKVICAVSNGEEKSYLQSLNPPIDSFVELEDKTNLLLSSIMEETGGLGVHIIIDNGVQLFNNEDDSNIVGEPRNKHTPNKHALISCLSIGGCWVTSHPSLQLDPQDSAQLHMRGATVGFLFEHVWTLASAKQGKLQHVLQNLIKNIDDGILKPNIRKVVRLDDAVEIIKEDDRQRFGKIVVKVDE